MPSSTSAPSICRLARSSSARSWSALCIATAVLMTACGSSPTQPCVAMPPPEPKPSIVIPLACPEYLTPLADPTLGACYQTTIDNAETYYACRKAMMAR